MQVTLQYFDGCPNWKEAEQRVVAALRGAPSLGQLTEVFRQSAARQ